MADFLRNMGKFVDIGRLPRSQYAGEASMFGELRVDAESIMEVRNFYMNPELLMCRRITAGLLYTPMQVQPSDLNRLYADLTQRYPYQTLQHLPDGVRMANPDSDCFIQLGRTQINENVTYFQANKEKCLDVFNMVCGRFNVHQFLTFGIKLTAFLPMSGPGAAVDFMDRCAFMVRGNDWDALGSGRKGAGFRVVLHQDGVLDLRIEPFFGDTSELYVELDVQHPDPFSNVENIGPWMDQAYEYMFGNVKTFLGAMAKRG